MTMKKLAAIAAVAALILPHHALPHSGGTDRYGCHEDSRTGFRHCHDKEIDTGGMLLRLAGLILLVGIVRSAMGNDEQSALVPQFSVDTRSELGNAEEPVLQFKWSVRY